MATTEIALLLSKLEAEVAEAGSQCTAPLPPHCPTTSLATIPKLFQFREMDPNHVKELGRALRDGASVPPILVLSTGRRLIVLDGHHRLQAHRDVCIPQVPIIGFEGNVKEAILEACAANSVTKLPMTPSERQDAAWRYVCLGHHSKAQIAKASGCSARTVATMRTVRTHLGEEVCQARTWMEAMRMSRTGREEPQTDEDRERWMETVAQRHADLLARTFSNRLTTNPEIAARALAIHFGRRIGALAEHLMEWLPEEGEADY